MKIEDIRDGMQVIFKSYEEIGDDDFDHQKVRHGFPRGMEYLCGTTAVVISADKIWDTVELSPRPESTRVWTISAEMLDEYTENAPEIDYGLCSLDDLLQGVLVPEDDEVQSV